MARYFDPAAYRIILVDQRGCGESTPFADLRDNTTYDSVRDFEKLREKLGIDKWQVILPRLPARPPSCVIVEMPSSLS